MLLAHLTAVEERLIARLRATAPSAAMLTTALAEDFFEPLFGGGLRIVSGALVGVASRPEAAHPGFDAMLCAWETPRLALPDGAPAWPVDTVVATVGVVPVLDEAAVAKAVERAAAAKGLAGTPANGPGLRCYLVAADGPADMMVAHTWLKLAYRAQGIVEPDMPDTGAERCAVASPALDGIFVLGRGFMNFDNVDIGFITDESRMLTFGVCWAVAWAERGVLMSMWLQMQQAAHAAAGRRLALRDYSAGFDVPRLRYAN